MKKLTTLLAAAAIACALLAGMPTTAQASSGTALDGTDPASTGCVNTGTKIFSRDLYFYDGIYAGTFEVWYSQACQTNWVRAYQPYTGDSSSLKTITRPSQAGLPRFTEQEWDFGQGWSYSMQVYAPGNTIIEVSGGLDGGAAQAAAQMPLTVLQ